MKSDYYKSPLGHENVDWFADEIIKLETKMNLWFKNTKKDIIMTEEDKQTLKITTFVDIVKHILKQIKLEIIVT